MYLVPSFSLFLPFPISLFLLIDLLRMSNPT